MVGQKEVCFLVTALVTYIDSLAFLEKGLKILLMYIGMYMSLSMCVSCVCGFPKRPGRALDPVGSSGRYEPPQSGAEIHTQFPWKSSKLNC